MYPHLTIPSTLHLALPWTTIVYLEWVWICFPLIKTCSANANLVHGYCGHHSHFPQVPVSVSSILSFSWLTSSSSLLPKCSVARATPCWCPELTVPSSSYNCFPFRQSPSFCTGGYLCTASGSPLTSSIKKNYGWARTYTSEWGS